MIGSHYSWDLPFNPGYVIGLSTVQAGLTPQTSVRLAMMRRRYISTRATSQRGWKCAQSSAFSERHEWWWNGATLRSRSSSTAAMWRREVACDARVIRSACHFLHLGVKCGHRADIKRTNARTHTHTHTEDFRAALSHRSKPVTPDGRCVTHMQTHNGPVTEASYVTSNVQHNTCVCVPLPVGDFFSHKHWLLLIQQDVSCDNLAGVK